MANSNFPPRIFRGTTRFKTPTIHPGKYSVTNSRTRSPKLDPRGRKFPFNLRNIHRPSILQDTRVYPLVPPPWIDFKTFPPPLEKTFCYIVESAGVVRFHRYTDPIPVSPPGKPNSPINRG